MSLPPKFNPALSSDQVPGDPCGLGVGRGDGGDPLAGPVHGHVYAGADGALKLAREMPEEYWEELKSK